jgi:very-short-patch-repair endonuclease
LRICKDGRIWGQTNKLAGTHLGVVTWEGYQKRGYNPNSARKKNSIKRICLFCGKEFYVQKSRAKKGEVKFCSRECLCQYKNVKRNCLLCNKTFSVILAEVKKGSGKFCSLSCSAAYYMKRRSRKATSIELKVEEYLKTLGIKYESQKVIPEGKTVADFYIPEQHLVIYADGVFWHKSEWAQKKGVVKRDNTQDLLLGLHGYNVLRLSEKEINNGNYAKKVIQEVRK